MRYITLVIKVLAIIMLSLSSLDVFSQSDGFFNNWSDFSSREDDDIVTPAMPGHGFDTDQSAPLGSGLLILLGLGAGYLALKKRSSLKKTTAAALVLLSLSAMSQQLEYDCFSTINEFYQLNNNSFDFIPGHGYLASYSAQGTKQFKGVFNQGDVTVNLTKTDLIAEEENKLAGFNLVGNPYPSFLDWEDTTGWDRSKIYGYGTKEANSQCVLWIYNEDAGNYATYIQGTKVSTNNGTSYIAPGQAFFVKATQAGNLVMRDGARTNEHTESGFMKDPNPNPDPNPSFVFQNGNDLIVKGKGHLQVVDVLGRTIFEKELTAEENVISCDYINKGINIFKLEDKTEKIIIR